MSIFAFFCFQRPKVTNVTPEHMNSVLGSVLKLINNNIDEQEAPWMKRIAGRKERKRNDFECCCFLFVCSLYSSDYFEFIS